MPELFQTLSWSVVALSCAGLTYAGFLRWLASRPKQDAPELMRLREELKDVKAKVDAMLIGGRQRG